MTINPTNIAKFADYAKTKFEFDRSIKKLNSNDISRTVSEKIETDNNGKTLFDTSVKNVVETPQPQYDPQAPVVKTKGSSKSMMEGVQNDSEKLLVTGENKLKDRNLTIEETQDGISNERKLNIGKGFYITVSPEHMEKLNTYSNSKEKLITMQKYNPDKKFDSGVLLDLVI